MARLAPPSPLARLWLVASVARRVAVAGRGAYLARLGRFRGRWRLLARGWCNTLPALLGALWRPFCGPCGGGCMRFVLAPCAALAGLAWLALAAVDSLRVVLAAVAVWAAPAAAVAVAGASIKRAPAAVGPCGPCGGVTLVAWSNCQ